MHFLSHLIRETIPNYFRDLPVPDTFAGIFHLGFADLFRLTPLIAVISGSTYYTVRYLRGEPEGGAEPVPRVGKRGKVNLNIKKDSSKVVDTCDIEEIGDKKVFCRCWRSKNFPYCDGSHTEHNNATGDNVGPLIIKK
jgi:CDGSH-type Zn-finger protein